ncbi:Wzz/FepE/Etk N-terminal domain-containing protein [Pseudoalteromonas sp. KAN5]|uniref:Wzz/FepE/Etk N-terminal domain-containing protein n=1 Tax=Pseudoalteromonas sp. KAN5 TaxID=2916633 RepID=UPI001FCB2233|nr:Wzz/FepE/Etk N-terminal domain-containing protein [Pseudoalteromonas sp. KAN5]BDF95583.1 LPS biosynthesis protein [Pseudoalteromonas sp. KAN5]
MNNYTGLSEQNNHNNTMHDDIDMRELLTILWKKKLLILLITFIFSVTAVIYSINLPNIYKSEALLAPAESEQSGGLAALAGQFGGMASLAGINLAANNGVNKVELAIAVIKSKQFSRNFIKRHKILPELMAAAAWDEPSNTLEYDRSLFNPENKKWVSTGELSKQPSQQEAYRIFSKSVSIEKSKEAGMFIISVKHLSPHIAQKWVSLIVQDINKEMKTRDVNEAMQSTDFLKKQIEQTNVTDIQKILYKLIEEQAKTIMFAEVRNEYIFKTVDPAIVPEKKYSPNRAVFSVLGFFVGLILSVTLVLVHFYAFKGNEKVAIS